LLVETEGRNVGIANFEEQCAGASGTGFPQHRLHQPPAQALPPESGQDGEIHQLGLAREDAVTSEGGYVALPFGDQTGGLDYPGRHELEALPIPGGGVRRGRLDGADSIDVVKVQGPNLNYSFQNNSASDKEKAQALLRDLEGKAKKRRSITAADLKRVRNLYGLMNQTAQEAASA